MKKLFITIVTAITTMAGMADTKMVASPDGKLVVSVADEGGRMYYSVDYDGKQMMKPSLMGLKANIGDFSEGLTYVGATERAIDTTYYMRGTKASSSHYEANQLNVSYINADSLPMIVTINVSAHDIALRYAFPQSGATACMVVESEQTSFNFPEETTTFITAQSDPMVGFARTKPSYEEGYTVDGAMTEKSGYGHGYTFPCLFHIGDKGWALVSETGNDGSYVGAHLSDYSAETGYTIAFPMEGEANGWGSATAGVALPGKTPWRTITIGETLKPIVETTVSYDVVEEKYPASIDYAPGRYTWSWLIWQDVSVNYDDQVKFIDLASEMSFEYVLVDNWWDKQIGRDRMEELSEYAQKKGVHLLLWYNSNGFENDAPQSPKNCMSTSVARKKEMAWLRSIGVKGIKVDFFGGDKQHTMQLYEDILSDANDYGILVVFHGCTLPRGWEKMYPNFVACEAVLASENVFFSDYWAEHEPFDLTLHPFCRNAVASMDWGGTIMNHYLAPDNASRHRRFTSDIFEMAAAITIQTSVQCIAMQPNNLDELEQFEMDFLKGVPTAWDETMFIDGYPGKYVVLARRSGNDWYVAGLNATDEAIKLEVSVPFQPETTVDYYYDKKIKKDALWPEPAMDTKKVGKDGTVEIEIQPNGGVILK